MSCMKTQSIMPSVPDSHCRASWPSSHLYMQSDVANVSHSRAVSHCRCRWRYVDPSGQTQGPFPAHNMLEWYRRGLLNDMTLQTCGAVRHPGIKCVHTDRKRAELLPCQSFVGAS